MDVYLFNCRLLQSVAAISSNAEGYFSIYTVFNPDELICFDAMFFTMVDEKDSANTDTQCTFFEETPKILDPIFDQYLLSVFDKMIKTNDFSEVTLPEDMAHRIKTDAMDFSMQMITN